MRCTYIRDEWSCSHDATDGPYCADHAPAPVRSLARSTDGKPHAVPSDPARLRKHVRGCHECLSLIVRSAPTASVVYREDPTARRARRKRERAAHALMLAAPAVRYTGPARAPHKPLPIGPSGADVIREYRRMLNPLPPRYISTPDARAWAPGQGVEDAEPYPYGPLARPR